MGDTHCREEMEVGSNYNSKIRKYKRGFVFNLNTLFEGKNLKSDFIKIFSQNFYRILKRTLKMMKNFIFRI